MAAEPAERQPNITSDGTTGAIYNIIETMGGKGDEGKTTAAPTNNGCSTARSRNPVLDLPPERTNTVLEDKLIQNGTFGKRSMAQRRVLGCLGCKLASQPGNTGAVRSKEIADCMGSENGPVRRILARLVETGFLKTGKRPDPTMQGNPDYFRFTARAVEFAFKRKLEVPAACGLNQDGGNRLNATAESILLDAGIINTKGSAPRAVLGCVACRLQEGDGVYAKGLQRCAGLAGSHHQSVLQRLVEGGVLEGRSVAGEHAGWNRTVYTPTDTEIGRRVAKSLEIPSYCGLEEQQGDD